MNQDQHQQRWLGIEYCFKKMYPGMIVRRLRVSVMGALRLGRLDGGFLWSYVVFSGLVSYLYEMGQSEKHGVESNIPKSHIRWLCVTRLSLVEGERWNETRAARIQWVNWQWMRHLTWMWCWQLHKDDIVQACSGPLSPSSSATWLRTIRIECGDNQHLMLSNQCMNVLLQDSHICRS